MAERPAVAVGSYAAALPTKPPRRNTTIPEALSSSEGLGRVRLGSPGVQPTSRALPEAHPLTGVARMGSTSTLGPRGGRTSPSSGGEDSLQEEERPQVLEVKTRYVALLGWVFPARYIQCASFPNLDEKNPQEMRDGLTNGVNHR